MENRWLSVDEIAEYVGVSRDTVYAWLGDRRMPGHRAGHKWRFQRDEVDEWLRSGGARSSGTSGQEGSDGR